MGFASDASTQAVYSRIHELRQALEAYGADIDIETSGGYRIVILEAPHNRTKERSNVKRKTQNAKRKTQNAKRKTQNAKRKTQNAKRKTQR